MLNMFDKLQDEAYKVIARNFGRKAKWESSITGDTSTCTVLYRDPSHQIAIGDSDYSPADYTIEYLITQFKGLKESVHEGNLEIVSVEISQDIYRPFYVRKCIAKFDGTAIIASLNETQ